MDAVGWLADYAEGVVIMPLERSNSTLSEYAESWLKSRELKPRTRHHYAQLLDAQILPNLGDLRLCRIAPAKVREWYGTLDRGTPTLRAHAYGLLRTICATAVSEDLLDTNPCRLRGASSSKTKHRSQIASLAEIETIVTAMPERYRAMVLLAAWCGLRYGELTALCRRGADLDAGVLRITQGVTHVPGRYVVGDPKSDAGMRTVAIPPHLMPALVAHLDTIGPEPGALLFPSHRGGHLAPSTFYRYYYPARAAAGRPDLRFHDLRHTGATLAAATGATLADLMSRMGHSTPAAALRYQHAAADRDRAIGEALSGFAIAKVIPLGRARA